MSELLKRAATKVVDDLMEDFFPTICNVMAAGVPVSSMSAIIPEVCYYNGQPRIIANFEFKEVGL